MSNLPKWAKSLSKPNGSWLCHAYPWSLDPPVRCSSFESL